MPLQPAARVLRPARITGRKLVRWRLRRSFRPRGRRRASWRPPRHPDRACALRARPFLRAAVVAGSGGSAAGLSEESVGRAPTLPSSVASPVAETFHTMDWLPAYARPVGRHGSCGRGLGGLVVRLVRTARAEARRPLLDRFRSPRNVPRPGRPYARRRGSASFRRTEIPRVSALRLARRGVRPLSVRHLPHRPADPVFVQSQGGVSELRRAADDRARRAPGRSRLPQRPRPPVGALAPIPSAVHVGRGP